MQPNMQPNPESNDGVPESDVHAAYQVATQRLNEVPSPRVRATVLAAAARAVQARPTAVGAPGTRPALKGTARRRLFPAIAAAAASVAVVSVAVLLALRMEEYSTEQGPASAQVAETAPLVVARVQERDEGRSTAPAAPAPRPYAPEPPPLELRAKAARQELAPAVVADHAADRATAAEHKAEAPKTEVEAMVVASAESAARLSGSVAAPEAAAEPPAAPVPNRTDTPQAAARSSNVARQRAAPAVAASAPAASNPVPEDIAARPQHWVERITRLRAAGQQAQADEELRQLRARYPDFVVPTAALR